MKFNTKGLHANAIRLATISFLVLQVLVFAIPAFTATVTGITLAGNDESSNSKISSDGQIVVFESYATNLVSPASTGVQVFTFDRKATSNAIKQVSLTSGDLQATADCKEASISGNGNFVVFQTSGQIGAGDNDNKLDVYRRDRQTGGTTIRVSVKTGGGQGSGTSPLAGESKFARINSTGNLITFVSSLIDLGGPVDGQRYGYVRDVSGNVTTCISNTVINAPVAISPDGNYLALFAGSSIYVYSYNNTNHTTALYNTFSDAYTGGSLSNQAANGKYYLVYENTSGSVVAYAIDNPTTAVENFAGSEPSISADGTCITYKSAADNNLCLKKISGASSTVLTGAAGDEYMAPAVSSSGRFISFQSVSTSLVAPDTNGVQDIFLTDLAAFKPDVQIANSSDGLYVGDGVYNTDGTSQTKSQTVNGTMTATYYVKIENDEPSYVDKFLVTGTGGGTYWTVNYFDATSGGNDITSQVTGSGWTSGSVNAGSSIEIRAEVTGSTTSRPFPIKNLLIKAASAESIAVPAPSDTVKATTSWQNSAPIAENDLPVVLRASVNNSLDVLANDTDADNDELTVTEVTQGSHNATVSIAPDSKSVIYTADPGGYEGEDVFTYTVSDGFGGTAVGTVTVTVGNYAPTADDGTFNAVAGKLRSGTLSASDPDDTDLTYSIVTGAGKGTVEITDEVNGTFAYTADPGQSGTDTFTFKVTDPHAAESNTATVTVTIYAPLTAASVSASSPTTMGTAITLTASHTGGGTLRYQFEVMSVKADGGASRVYKRDYLANPSCVWTPTEGRPYYVKLTAMDVMADTPYAVSVKQKVLVTSAKLTGIASVTATAPYNENSPITLTAVPVGTGPFEYMFEIVTVHEDGSATAQTVRTWAAADTCEWTPTEARPYIIRATVREAGINCQGSFSATTKITVVSPRLTNIGLTATVQGGGSPRINNPINLAAVLTGTGPAEYQFDVLYLSGPNLVTEYSQPYSTTSTCQWTPTVARTYILRIRAREVGVDTQYSFTKNITNYVVGN